jgi:hypothetical protein
MSKKLIQTKTAVLAACVTCLLLAGCLEDAQMAEPVAATEQPINEVKCGFSNLTPPDFSCQVNTPTPGHFSICGRTSPSDSYGQPLCQNAWIGDVLFTGRGQIDVSYAGGVLADNSVFPCDAMWVRRIVILESLAKIDSIAFGTGTTRCRAPVLEPLSVAPGNYRVLSQAGIITSYAKVSIRFNGSF